MSDVTVLQKVDSICNIAIENAKSFGKNLDFDKKSIIDVEEILDYLWKDLHKGFIKNIINKIKGEKPTETQIFSMASVWGTYVGEVMRREIGDRCIWVNENVSDFGVVMHIKLGGKRAFPIEKAYKRLINGPEDSVKFFYDVMIIKLLE